MVIVTTDVGAGGMMALGLLMPAALAEDPRAVPMLCSS